ncbi:MAG TPA: nucleotidyltransferase domain-containing protein [Labilithrix sp.]|nr:nucleotidyltransferase domain-containing protein [Labilithrix sp.]
MQQDLLIARLEKVSGLVAAYLFGSHARGEARQGSDVDIALWLHDAPATLDDLQLDLAADLERELGVPVDIVILNGAPSDLVHRVLRDGVLLVERDRSARVRLEVRARNDYFDLLPMRTAYRRRRGGPAP